MQNLTMDCRMPKQIDSPTAVLERPITKSRTTSYNRARNRNSGSGTQYSRFSGKRIEKTRPFTRYGTILVVAPDFPFPPDHGGRSDIWNRIKTLNKIGHRIDLVATTKQKPRPEHLKEVYRYVRSVTIVNREQKVSDHFSPIPYQIKCRNSLRKVALSGEYDIVFLESEFVYPILDNPALKAGQTVLRIQNHESSYFRELARSVKWGLEKLYYLLESFKFHLIESSLYRRVRNMLFISSSEYESHRRKHPESNAAILPAPIEQNKMRMNRADSKTVLFVGSLFMANNREALNWYIEKVHPLLADIKDYQFLAAGNSREGNIDWLYSLARNHANIKIIDSPEDITPLYDQSAVFVNSMLHGAGVKIKNIDAIRNGLPVVTTTVGNQGTGLVNGIDIMVENDPELFAQDIRELLSNRYRRHELVRSAQENLKKNYNHRQILERYLSPLMTRVPA
jgi:glycosyltransferase involved in cell wall biosynthesis